MESEPRDKVDDLVSELKNCYKRIQQLMPEKNYDDAIKDCIGCAIGIINSFGQMLDNTGSTKTNALLLTKFVVTCQDMIGLIQFTDTDGVLAFINSFCTLLSR